jgi:hypothetical protein
MSRPFLFALAVMIAPVAFGADRDYRIHYGAEFRPDTGVAAVTIRVDQARGELRRLTLTLPSDRYRDFAGSGVAVGTDGTVVWDVPRRGGELHYLHAVDHRRGGDGFDARLTANWGILKADRLFPPMRARTVQGAESEASLGFTGPPGWLFQTRYGRVRDRLAFDDPARRFDRPTGWMIVGHIAARREEIAERYVLVTSPAGENFRHNDVMAFLTWNLPVLVELLPSFPDRLLIVGGGAEMWRGGLSGAGSLYVHRDRPLISQNGTSPLLHELVHVGSRLSGKAGGDWIVEGLAEYYGIETLRRSGTVSVARHAFAFASLDRWADEREGCLAREASTGANTARAALVLRALDHELRDRSRERVNLDVVLRRLVGQGAAVDEDALRHIVEDLLGAPSTVLATAPRCSDATSPAQPPRSSSSS